MKTMKYRTIFSLAALVAGAMVGCSDGVGNGITGQSCTEIGCGPSFHVEFSRATWPAGMVNVAIEAEGTTTNCTVTLPFASCDNTVQCDQANSAFLIETSGCALPSDQHSILGVVWTQNGPNQVTVTVSQDGTVLGTKMFQPTYTTSRPNGDGCEPVCNQSQTPASITL